MAKPLRLLLVVVAAAATALVSANPDSDVGVQVDDDEAQQEQEQEQPQVVSDPFQDISADLISVLSPEAVREQILGTSDLWSLFVYDSGMCQASCQQQATAYIEAAKLGGSFSRFGVLNVKVAQSDEASQLVSMIFHRQTTNACMHVCMYVCSALALSRYMVFRCLSSIRLYVI
jgi:hypothetical protein